MMQTITSHLKSLRPDPALILYGAVGLVLLGPLLLPGFIFTLDMVFPPKLPMPSDVTSSYVWRAFLHVLNLALPAEIIQKLLLLTILVLAGYGAHRLARRLRLADGALLYSSGLLYMVNPFSYERFMAGQYNVLFGYALLPWVVVAAIVFAGKPNLPSAAKLVSWALLLSVVSIHSIIPAAFLALLFIGRQLVRSRVRRQSLKGLLRWSAAVAIILVLASSYWLLPLVNGTSSQASLIGGFGQQDSQAFATGGGSVTGRLANVLRLQGFWPERYAMFILPQDHVPTFLWAMAMLGMLALVAIGLASLWHRSDRGLSGIVVCTILIGGMLGAGIGSD